MITQGLLSRREGRKIVAGPWVLDVFTTERGEALVQAFMAALTGRDRDEAFALVRLLGEQGNALRRPQSGILGEGLF